MKITHLKEKNRFELSDDGHTATLDYIPRQNHIVIYEIEVPKYLETQGAVTELIKFSLDYARKNNLKVFPMHHLVTRYMAKDTKSQDLLLIK